MVAAAAGRYLSLDHWRGFAALWVLVFHAHRGQPPLEPWWLGEFVRHGWLGVQVFFVVSGYCIAERTDREYHEHGTALRFLLDRLLRIYPPYWAALIVTISLNIAGAIAKDVPISSPFVLPAGPAGWAMAIAGVEPWYGQATFLLVAWTLAYEVGFYVCAAVGLAVAIQSRRPWAGAAIWGLLLVVGLFPDAVRWVPLLELWPQFALGGVVWLARRLPGPAWGQLAAGGAAVGCFWIASCWQREDLAFQLRFSCGVAWGLLLFRPFDQKLAGAFVLRWLGWIGTFSYSLYLVHAPIVGKFGNLMGRWPPLAHQPLLLLGLGCALTLPFAWWFYRQIEVRSNAARRRVMASGSPQNLS